MCVYNSYSSLYTVVVVVVVVRACVRACVCVFVNFENSGACVYSSACILYKHIIHKILNIVMNESHIVCVFVSVYTVCILFSQ